MPQYLSRLPDTISDVLIPLAMADVTPSPTVPGHAQASTAGIFYQGYY